MDVVTATAAPTPELHRLEEAGAALHEAAERFDQCWEARRSALVDLIEADPIGAFAGAQEALDDMPMGELRALAVGHDDPSAVHGFAR
jgi:hypothetical protein